MSLPIPEGSKLPRVVKELNALGVRVTIAEEKIAKQAIKNESFETRFDSLAAESAEIQSHWADIHERITALEEKVRSLIPCPGDESDAILTPNEDGFLFQAVDDVDVDTEAQTLSVSGEIAGAITAVSNVAWLTVTQIGPTSFSMVANPTGLVPETYFGLVTVSGENVQTLIVPITFIVAPFVSVPAPILTVVEPSFDFDAIESGAAPDDQTINIKNTGTGDLDGPVIVQVGGDAPWLTIGAVTGSADDWQATISVDDTLTVGTHTKTIRVTDTAAPGQSVDRVVTVEVTAAATLNLSVSPATLNFVAVEGGSPASSQFIDIIGTGTQDFAGPTVAEVGGDAAWLTTNITMVNPKHYRCEVTLDTDAELAGVLNKTLRFSDANQTNGAQDSVVTVTISSSSSSVTEAGTIEAFVAGTGSRLVSGPIWLPEGRVFPTDLANFRILKSGVEQAIFIKDHGIWRHTDGSLRAVFVQSVQTLTAGVPVAFEYEVGIARNVSNDIAETAVALFPPAGNNYKTAVPEAIWNFPKEYLCSCKPFTAYELRPQGTVDGLEESYDDNFFTDFDIFSVTGGIQAQEGGLNLDPYAQYKKWDGQPNSATIPFLQYDAGFIHINHYLMTGNIEHLRAGLAYAAWYSFVYAVIPNNVAPWMVSPMQMMAGFAFTGDPLYKTRLEALTLHHFSISQTPGGGRDDWDDEMRPMAFRLLCGYACHMAGITSVNWKARTDTYFAGMLLSNCWIASGGPNDGGYYHRLMFNNGSCGLTPTSEVTHNFFHVIWVPTVIEYEGVFNAVLPAGIQTKITGVLEFLRLTQYRPTGNSAVTTTPDFKYQNKVAGTCGITGPGSDVYNLNGLYAGAFQMAGKRDGNAAWKAMGENMLETMQRRTHRGPGAGGNGPYYFNARTLSECYRWFYAAFSLRSVANWYPDLPFDLPFLMDFDTATNKPTNSPLSWRYSNNLVTSWLNIDASLGSNAVANMATLQAQINADASGTPVRRGYEFANTRQFDGSLVWPHNSATGTSALRPIGYTYDADLKLPPSAPRTAPTFVATVGNTTSAMATSFSGANDQNHGRIAVMGCDFTVATTLGQTFTNNFNAAIIDFGSPYADQSSASRRPNGFLLHDCRVFGYSTGWVRRGLGIHGENVEVRACWFDEIHSNPYGASGKDAQCIAGWNGTSKVEIRYSVLHGADENIAWGGGGPLSADQVVGDIWVDHCDLGKSTTYLANWGHKNAYESKCGHRQLITFCRLWGMSPPNDNQGYAFTIKSGIYGSAPTEGTSNVHAHGCWVEKYPGFCATISREGGVTGVLANRLSFTDCFSWNQNIAPYNQPNVRLVLAQNDTEAFNEISFSHCTFATSMTAAEAIVFGQAGALPNFKFNDCILPYGAYGFWNSTGMGLTMLNNVAPGPTWQAARNTFVPKTGMSSGYPTTAPNDGWTAEASFASLGMVDQAVGNLRLDVSSSYYKGNANAAPDGWNRGVTDPNMVYNELAETPIYS